MLQEPSYLPGPALADVKLMHETLWLHRQLVRVVRRDSDPLPPGDPCSKYVFRNYYSDESWLLIFIGGRGGYPQGR